MSRRQRKRKLKSKRLPAYKMQLASSFWQDALAAPKQIQNKLNKDVFPKLEYNPANAEDQSLKKLDSHDSLWRCRLGDYRLIYGVDSREREVTFLALGHRRNIYEQLETSSSSTSTQFISDDKAATLIVPAQKGARQGTKEKEHYSKATLQTASLIAKEGSPRVTPKGTKDAAIDRSRLAECIAEIDVDVITARKLNAATTEGALLEVCGSIPGELGDKVLELMYPKPIDSRLQEPVRRLPRYWKKLELNEHTSLESLLLKLDDEQKLQVRQFESSHPKGPWMVKGGPGSGKSTIAIHCIKALIEQTNRQQEIFDQAHPIRVLFTSYTKSLVNSARSLISHMGGDASAVIIDASNLDRLVARHIPAIWNSYSPVFLNSSAGKTIFSNALRDCKATNKNFLFSNIDLNFLEEEISWVILGDNVDSLESYLNVDRAGRGRRLGANQRQNVWTFWEALKNQLRKEKHCLFPQRVIPATDNVEGTYDFVFIDEAQDLTPASIKFCLKLAKDPSRVFLTADTNQSIYGVGIAWSKISSALNFRGRSRILKRNYRTNKEICTAITPLISGLRDNDIETIGGEPVASGVKPTLIGYSDVGSEPEVINKWLIRTLLEERASPMHAAVLCRSKNAGQQLARQLDKTLNAKMLTTDDDILGHPGVKILTAHSAKGLQFPVVVVAGLEEGKFPFRARTSADESEHYAKDQRLLFVACTRAMRRLALSFNTQKKSRYIELLEHEHWELE